MSYRPPRTAPGLQGINTLTGSSAWNGGMTQDPNRLAAARYRQMHGMGTPAQQTADRFITHGAGSGASAADREAESRRALGFAMDQERARAAFEGQLAGIRAGAARQAAEGGGGGTGEPRGPRVGVGGPRRFSMGGPVLGEQRGPRVGVGGPVLGEQRGLRFGMGGPVIGEQRGIEGAGVAGGRGFEGVGFEGGGPVDGPGTSTSDSIPAWLSDDEYVIKADAVKKYGEHTFEALNNMRVPKSKVRGFSEGGPSRWGRGEQEPRREREPKLEVPGGTLGRARYNQDINPVTNRARLPTRYEQELEINALQKRGEHTAAQLLRDSYDSYRSGNLRAIEDADRRIMEYRSALALPPPGGDQGSGGGRPAAFYEYNKEAKAQPTGSEQGGGRPAAFYEYNRDAPSGGAAPPPAAPSFGSTLKTMSNNFKNTALPLPGTDMNPSSGTVEKLTPTSAEVRYPSGRGSVNYGPRKEPAMIEGIPAQQWFQEAANRQRQGNRFAQPTLQAQYQNKYAGEPGYPGGPKMSAKDERAWAAAAKQFGSTRRAR